MPPKENTNKNNSPQNAFKVGLDPVFNSYNTSPKISVEKNTPAGLSHPVEAGGVYDALSNQKYVPNQPPVMRPLESFSNNHNPKSVIRTYKSDLESVIQADHLSSVNIAIAENKKMHKQIKPEQKMAETEPPTVQTESNYSKSKIIIFISLLLIIAGIIGLVITFLVGNRNFTPVKQAPKLPALITTEYQNELNIDPIAEDKFTSTISNNLNDIQTPLNNFYNIYVTTGTGANKRLVTSLKFISLLKFRLPDLLKRTLLPDFMIGTYTLEKNLPFLILKTSSFEGTYAGMLAWEKDLEKDLTILFRLPGYETSGNIITELTPTNLKKFSDAVIVNKDVRILQGIDGKIMLLYGIVDKETIIITVNEDIFKELINRLNKEKTLKR